MNSVSIVRKKLIWLGVLLSFLLTGLAAPIAYASDVQEVVLTEPLSGPQLKPPVSPISFAVKHPKIHGAGRWVKLKTIRVSKKCKIALPILQVGAQVAQITYVFLPK